MNKESERLIAQHEAEIAVIKANAVTEDISVALRNFSGAKNPDAKAKARDELYSASKSFCNSVERERRQSAKSEEKPANASPVGSK